MQQVELSITEELLHKDLHHMKENPGKNALTENFLNCQPQRRQKLLLTVDEIFFKSQLKKLIFGYSHGCRIMRNFQFFSCSEIIFFMQIHITLSS